MRRSKKALALTLASALALTPVQMNLAVTAEAAAVEGNELAEIPVIEQSEGNEAVQAEGAGESAAVSLNTLVDGLEALDEMAKNPIEYNWNTYERTVEDLPGVEVTAKPETADTVSVNYQLTAKSKDGKDSVVVREESISANGVELYGESAPLFRQFGTAGNKQVGSYELSINFYQSGVLVGNKKAEWTVVCHKPIEFEVSETEFPARKNEAKLLSARAYSTTTADIGEITYQWYKDGSLMEGETLSNLYVKIADYTSSYKCVVDAPGLKDKDVITEEKSHTFKPEKDTGYRLKKKSGQDDTYVLEGNRAALFVDAEVDPEYTMEYQWQKIESLSANGFLVTKDIQGAVSSTYEIVQTSSSDFVGVYYEGEYVTHRLVISFKETATGNVLPEKEIVLFALQKDWESAEDIYYIDSNLQRWDDSYSKTIEWGDDITLYLKHEPKKADSASYSIEKNWYKVQTAEYEAKKDVSGNFILDEKGNYTYDETIPLNAVTDKTETEYYGTTKKVTYYIALPKEANGYDCIIKGKDSTGKAVDISGKYNVEVKAARAGKGESRTNYYVNLKYDSKLKAYAKESDVSALAGSPASFEVVASNKNAELYPITYKWEKWNKTTGAYEPIAGANSNVYSISAVAAKDYGTYRAVVEDLSKQGDDAVTVEFTLDNKVPVIYTPDDSYYSQSIGDNVTLEVKADIPAVSVNYNWYWGKSKEIGDSEWRQIINQNDSKYTFTVAEVDLDSVYKCVITYRLNKDSEYKTKECFFHIKKAADDISLESTTPRTQYAQIGDSRTYGVRYKTSSADIKDTNIAYQWSRYDKEKEEFTEIAGAVNSTYTVEKLEAKDFNYPVMCEVYLVSGTSKKFLKSLRFYTLLYSDVTVEKNEDATKDIECVLGSDVTIAPIVKNPSNKELTYEWSFDGDSIPGAAGASYTISKISERQLGEYTLTIYESGIEVDSYSVIVKNKKSKIKLVSENYDKEVTVAVGEKVTFSAEAKSDDELPIYYQWYRDGEAIGGATEAKYEIGSAQAGMAGEYSCRIKDSKGIVRETVDIRLIVNTITADSGYWDVEDSVGYPVKIGDTVTLKAQAAAGEGYTVFYQWYKENKDNLGNYRAIAGAVSNELTLSKITMDDIGNYQCVVRDEKNTVKTLNYRVYINTGLVVEPSVALPVAASDGSITMYVEAKANKGEKITYKWLKWNSEAGEFEDISGAVSRSYKIPKITKEVRTSYQCVVSTGGEDYRYHYTVKTMRAYTQSRMYAEHGDKVTLKAALINKATDATYTYKWYAQDEKTGDYEEIKSAASGSYTAVVPDVTMGEMDDYGLRDIKYGCNLYEDGEQEFDYSESVEVFDESLEYAETGKDFTMGFNLKVLPTVTYVTKLPETSHPYEKRADIKGYTVKGAKNLKVTLDTRSDTVLLIDSNGKGYWMSGTGKGERILTIPGNKAIFVAGSPILRGGKYGYGYKASSIVNPAASTTKKVPAKNSKHKIGNLTYKVTKSNAKTGTVSVVGVKNKKTLKTASVPKTVKISGYTFKVTAIGASAFKGCKNLTKVTIAVNVASIGKQAFANCSKLKTITIKTTKLTAKKVGANAFKGIAKTAKIKVPKKKLASYKKILKAKGVGKKVKITK